MQWHQNGHLLEGAVVEVSFGKGSSCSLCLGKLLQHRGIYLNLCLQICWHRFMLTHAVVGLGLGRVLGFYSHQIHTGQSALPHPVAALFCPPSLCPSPPATLPALAESYCSCRRTPAFCLAFQQHMSLWAITVPFVTDISSCHWWNDSSISSKSL